MNIGERRYIAVINKILREELQRGNLPSSKEFIWKINQYLQAHDVNAPALKFGPVRNGTTARADDYNKVLEDLYTDLRDLYISAIDQHNASIKHFNKFEVEKEKLDYQLNVLENQLKELILLYSNDGYLNSVYDMFIDMNHIDTEKTTATVDVRMHEVKISDVKNSSKRVVPTLATGSFEVVESLRKISEVKAVSGVPSDALNDLANQTWQALVTSSAKVDMAGYFRVAFSSPQLINRITISMQSVKPCFVAVEFTGDNLNWFPLPYYEKRVQVENGYTFDFPYINMRQVRFQMIKGEPDTETLEHDVDKGDIVKYSYLFGIKNISFFTNTYANQATLVSKVHEVEVGDANFTIDKVSLTVDEELPNGTDIKYYVALPVATGEPEWKAISPVNRANPQYEQIIDYKNISASTPTRFMINPSISIGEYEVESLYANGIKFYKIGEIAGRQIIDGTDKLYVGKDTWGMKYYTYQHPDHTTHLPDISDWDLNNPKGTISMNYVKIVDGKPGLLLNKSTSTSAMNYMFTLGVFSNKAKDVVTAIPAGTDPIAIYMNGERIFQGIPDANSRVTYVFNNGWNEIVVLVYNRQTQGTPNGATIDINIDPRKYGSSVYSRAKPMKRVPLFDLRYNTNNTYGSTDSGYEKYAVMYGNGKTSVILNHAIPGLAYEYYYNYIDGTVQDKILLKADLFRDDSITELSPKLKNYRLRFS